MSRCSLAAEQLFRSKIVLVLYLRTDHPSFLALYQSQSLTLAWQVKNAYPLLAGGTRQPPSPPPSSVHRLAGRRVYRAEIFISRSSARNGIPEAQAVLTCSLFQDSVHKALYHRSGRRRHSVGETVKLDESAVLSSR